MAVYRVRLQTVKPNRGSNSLHILRLIIFNSTYFVECMGMIIMRVEEKQPTGVPSPLKQEKTVKKGINMDEILKRNTETAVQYLKYIAAGTGSEGKPAFDQAFAMVADNWEIEVMPSSLKMPRMKLAPYRAWLEPMVKDQFVSFEVNFVNTTAEGNRVVIEATSTAKTADGRDYGQQYFIAFEFDEAGKITLQKEYTDSLYSSRFYTKSDRPKD